MIAFAASAGSYPEFNKARKMKPNEVFTKCGEWAKEEIKSMKDGTQAEKDKRADTFLSKAEACSLKNGFDPKGDSGNLARIKASIKKGY